MPTRSSTVRGVPPSAGMMKRRVSYGAVKPVRGAAEYASSRLSGDHEKLSTYCADGVIRRGAVPLLDVLGSP